MEPETLEARISEWSSRGGAGPHRNRNRGAQGGPPAGGGGGQGAPSSLTPRPSTPEGRCPESPGPVEASLLGRPVRADPPWAPALPTSHRLVVGGPLTP